MLNLPQTPFHGAAIQRLALQFVHMCPVPVAKFLLYVRHPNHCCHWEAYLLAFITMILISYYVLNCFLPKTVKEQLKTKQTMSSKLGIHLNLNVNLIFLELSHSFLMLKSKPTISSLGLLCCCFQSSGWFVWNLYLAVMAHRDLVILIDRSREETHLEKNKNFPSLEFLWPPSSGMCLSHPGPDVILGRCQGIFRGVLLFGVV